jgi:serine/threonine-protein kinase HipA
MRKRRLRNNGSPEVSRIGNPAVLPTVLCNHGFFISQDGISLAPAYDMNPSMERNELTLAINEVEATCDISIAMDASSDYGISKDEADGVIQEVKGAVGSWRAEAASLRIPKAEQEFMAAAFE